MAAAKVSSSAAACVAALVPHIAARRVARFRDVLSRRVKDTCVVLENLGDPRNCSAVVRTADALGVQTLCVIERYERWNRIDSVDKGAGKWLSVETFRTAAECTEWLHQRDFALFATDLSPGAIPLDAAVKASLVLPSREHEAGAPTPADAVATPLPTSSPSTAGSVLAPAAGSLRLRPRVAIALGNEHRGVSRALVAHAAHSFFIPQAGFVQSLNVSVAAAIALHSFLHRTPDYGCAITAGRHGGLVVHDETDASANAGSSVVASEAGHPETGLAGEGAAPASGAAQSLEQLALPHSPSPGVVAAGSDSLLRTEYLSDAERDELLLQMLLTSMNNADKILQRKGVRPPDL